MNKITRGSVGNVREKLEKIKRKKKIKNSLKRRKTN